MTLKRTRLKRTSELERTPMKRKPPKKSPRNANRTGWQKVVRTGCLMCRSFPVPAALRVGRHEELRIREWHHVVGQRHLRRAGLEPLCEDPTNGICLCRYHHARHEGAVQRVPRAILPATAVAWAIEHGFEWVLDKEYAW